MTLQKFHVDLIPQTSVTGLPDHFSKVKCKSKIAPLIGNMPWACEHLAPTNKEALKLFKDLWTMFPWDLHSYIMLKDDELNRYYEVCVNCGKIEKWCMTLEEVRKFNDEKTYEWIQDEQKAIQELMNPHPKPKQQFIDEPTK